MSPRCFFVCFSSFIALSANAFWPLDMPDTSSYTLVHNTAKTEVDWHTVHLLESSTPSEWLIHHAATSCTMSQFFCVYYVLGDADKRSMMVGGTGEVSTRGMGRKPYRQAVCTYPH